MKYPEELDEERVMEKWREAIKSAPLLISSIFKDGKIRAMSERELDERLGERGVEDDDRYDVICEGEREKLITLDYNTWSAYFWIPPERREEERKKTEELEKMVESVFLERGVKELPEDELKRALTERELSAGDVKRAIYEAHRDCVVSSFIEGKVEKYKLVSPEERERGREMRRRGRLYTARWLYERAEMGLEL